MSYLKLGYLDIPFRSVSFATDGTHHDFYSHYNTIGGPKWTRSRLSSNVTDLYLTADMGQGATASAKYLYLGNARNLKSTLNNVYVQRSSNGSSWSTHIQVASFSGVTLLGPRADDYITYDLGSTAYRYWRVRLNAGSSTDMEVSKIFYGDYLDFGVEPDYEFTRQVFEGGVNKSASGAAHIGNSQFPVYEFTFKWQGLTDAEITSFLTKIVRYKDRSPIPIWTEDEHDILDNQKLIYAKLMSFETTKEDGIAGYNRLSATFREVA